MNGASTVNVHQLLQREKVSFDSNSLRFQLFVEVNAALTTPTVESRLSCHTGLVEMMCVTAAVSARTGLST